MEGARLASGGGRVGGVRGVRRPEPRSARADAAQEVWLGFLRRLIPRLGQARLPGALGARRKLSPIVWAFVVRTGVVGSSGSFRCEQDVVAAVGDLARDGHPGAAAATAADDPPVEIVLGARVAVAVVGGLDEGPAEVA